MRAVRTIRVDQQVVDSIEHQQAVWREAGFKNPTKNEVLRTMLSHRQPGGIDKVLRVPSPDHAEQG